MDLQPDTALVTRDGKEVEVSVTEVKVGDQVRVKPGERIPIDGKVIKGKSSVDESLVTGESISVEKEVNNEVIGGSINQSGTGLSLCSGYVRSFSHDPWWWVGC